MTNRGKLHHARVIAHWDSAQLESAGDTSAMILWICVLAIPAGAIVGCIIFLSWFQ